MTENWINIDIKTEVTIAAAHFVQTTKSQCNNLHGHNWRVEVEINGIIKEDGMVIDFIDIKRIINQLDHKFLIPSQSFEIMTKFKSPENIKSKLVAINDMKANIVCVVPESWICWVDVPVITAEYLAEYIQRLIKKEAEGLSVKIKVWESDKSYASI
jgi:queuosine biosynthesis protein QueD